MKGSCTKKAKGESTSKPNWLELPIDLMKNILQRLDTVEIVTIARNVCPLWRNICKDPLMWRTIHMTCRFNFSSSSMEKICRCAIDLSCGQLEDIAVRGFGTDELLKYMAHRASHLRRLQLFGWNEISDRGLSEFVKRFSLLEELSCSNSLSQDCLEVIGRSCPLLKSLNLENLFFIRRINAGLEISYDEDDKAFVIAKTMSGLRHLKLNGFFSNSGGLVAILDGCPLLESLHLRGCRCSKFSPGLEKRFREKIKDLQLSNYL